ncbi:MAG: hypothetical protein JXB14_03005, partial [Candidatus Altiarchaeota archaeon]|nr:hypothetical protein [Candidatus Altiarchaeota archaeon]
GAFPQGLRGSSQDSQDQSSATEQTQQSRGQQIVDYKSSIKVTKEATFTFSTSYTGTATLTLEYTGVNNERVKQTEQITIGSGTSLTSDSTLTAGRFTSIRRGGGSPFDTLIYVVAAVILGYLGYRYYKKRRKGEVKSKGWKNLFGFI